MFVQDHELRISEITECGKCAVFPVRVSTTLDFVFTEVKNLHWDFKLFFLTCLVQYLKTF